MSLNYFLSCKKEYIKVVQHLECIVQTLDTIHYISLNEIPNSYNQENNKSFFTYKIKHFKDLIDNCNNNLHNLCCHNYVDDTIDVDEDRCQNITYCTICETVKPE
jgi:hypothetical protein